VAGSGHKPVALFPLPSKIRKKSAVTGKQLTR
jgi:hypothetical protein